MGWKKIPNSAQYGQGDWSNFVKKVDSTTSEEAKRIAFADSEITFFFFCRQTIILDCDPAVKYGPFVAGDAVFFKGKPWYGSAPQCDSYEKTPISTIYISPANNQQFQDIGNYVLADGSPAIDVVCIFAGDYATNTIPMLRAHNNVPPTTNPFDDNIQNVLSSEVVRSLQQKGITILLTILNAHTQTGWSQFKDEATARDFVDYLNSHVVSKYGLDGIDIDDEYSSGPFIASSLAMVTTLMKKAMPHKLITKALYEDDKSFNTSWKGHTLGANLDYGWEMSYYAGGPNSRLQQYLNYGMKKSQLCLGFSAEKRFSKKLFEVGPAAAATISDGYAGGMLFNFENQPQSILFLKAMVDAMHGAGNWNNIGTADSKRCCCNIL